MFSEAISSISSRWRESSLSIRSAISASACAREAEKNASSCAVRAAASVGDIRGSLHCTWRINVTPLSRYHIARDAPRTLQGLARPMGLCPLHLGLSLAGEARSELPQSEPFEV